MVFHSKCVQEIAYDSLLRARSRRKYHRKINIGQGDCDWYPIRQYPSNIETPTTSLCFYLKKMFLMHFNHPWTRFVSQSHTATVPIRPLFEQRCLCRAIGGCWADFCLCIPCTIPIYTGRLFTYSAVCTHGICAFYVRIDWRTAAMAMHMRKRLQCREKCKIEALEKKKVRLIETNATDTTIPDFVHS